MTESLIALERPARAHQLGMLPWRLPTLLVLTIALSSHI